MPHHVPYTTSHSVLTTLTRSMMAMTLCTAGFAHAHDYESVTFFGDSLTDGGYFSPLTQAPLSKGGLFGIAESGQFTTNPDDTWATSFAEQLGATAIANTYDGSQTGNNYAIGGARAGEDVTAFGIPVASTNSKVKEYLTNNTADPNGLYVVWAGANDLLAVAEDPKNAQTIISAAVASQVDTINALKNSGANHILVPNIPDIGLTPDAIKQGAAVQAESTYITALYNQFMYTGAKNTGANIIPLDTFGLLRQVAANPMAYGFSNMTKPACTKELVGDSALFCGSDNLATPDAQDTYFFADGIHPSGSAHQLIADYANAVVTAPSLIGVLPHIVTTSGQATSERLVSHLNHIQNATQKPERALWAVGTVANQDVAGLTSDGGLQALFGVDFSHPNSDHAITGLYGNFSKKEFTDSTITTGLSSMELGEVGMGVYHSNKLGSLGGLQVNAHAGFANMDVEVTRTVMLDRNQQQFISNADGKRYYANIQIGYPLQIHHTAVTPYAGATANRVKIKGLKEKELSGIAMQFDEQKYTTTHSKLGININHSMRDDLDVFGDIYYQKQLSDNQEAVTARLNTLPNMSFSTPITTTDDDTIAMTVGVSKRLGQLTTRAGVTHSQGDSDQSTSLFVGLSSAF